jgi:hypothetical protein
MNESKRGTLVTGIVLVILGAAFIIINLIPGITPVRTWPFIFIVAGVGFFLPALIWPEAREGLAGLYIPGAIFLTLGGIFLFNTLSGHWAIWAYAWILIPASVGLGLFLGAMMGGWDKGVSRTGIWMMVISATVFAFTAALFGDNLVRIFGAGFLVAIGLFILIRALMKKPNEG